MPTLVLGSAAVDVLTRIGQVQPATRVGAVPEAFAAGVCILAVAAVLRAALVIHLAAFRSVVPLLRAIVLIVLIMVLLSAISLTVGDSPQASTHDANASTSTGHHATPSRNPADRQQ